MFELRVIDCNMRKLWSKENMRNVEKSIPESVTEDFP